jgi:hypothetical protein
VVCNALQHRLHSKIEVDLHFTIMSLAVGQGYHNLAVSTVCQLEPEWSGAVCNSFLELAERTVFVCGGELHTTTKEQQSSNLILRGVVGADLFDIENEIVLALDQFGYVIALQPYAEGVDVLCHAQIFGDPCSHNEIITNGYIKVDKIRNVLVLLRNDMISIHGFDGYENDCILAVTMAQCVVEQPSSFCSLWGNENNILLAFTGASSDIFIIHMRRLNGEDENWETIKTDGSHAQEVVTKHEAWITALSSVSSGYSEISVTGDCTGALIVWELTTPTAKNAFAPLRYVLRSAAICEGHAITAVLHDTALNDLWIGDITGAITSAHLSIRSKALYPTRRLMLFGTLGGPSFLSWKPAEQAGAELKSHPNQVDENVVSAPATTVLPKPSATGTLRAFSPACGMLVQCTITSSIEAIFRVSAQPTARLPQQRLGLNHVGRVSAPEVATLHSSLVDVCAYLPHWNMIAVTSSRSRHIQLFDLYSGLLQCSIPTTESNCKSLAAYDSPPTALPSRSSAVAFIAAGYNSGKFTLIKLSRRVTNSGNATAPVATSVVGSVPTKQPASEVKAVPAASSIRPSRRSSKAESQHSHKSSSKRRASANANRKVSIQEVDILDAVGPQTSIEYDVVKGGEGLLVLEDDRSEASDTSLQYRDELMWASDEDSVGAGADPTPVGTTTGVGPGGGAALRRGSRRRSSALTGISSVDYRRGSSAAPATDAITYNIELSTSFCPLPITDILFSTVGGFIAIVHIRKIIVVFNNHDDAKKMSLKVSFEECLSDIRCMVPSELTPNNDIDRGNHSEAHRPSRRESEDRTYTFTDASGRRTSLPSTTVEQSAAASEQPPELGREEDESFVLLLQTRTRVRLLDGIKGHILTEFPLQTGDAKVVSSAAWDIPVVPDILMTATGDPAAVATNSGTAAHVAERAITGLCVAQGMRVFLFGEDSGEFRRHFLHDQVPLLTGPLFSTSLHTGSGIYLDPTGYLGGHGSFDSPGGALHAASAFHKAPSHLAERTRGTHGSSPNSLDNVVQGVSIHGLAGYSPLACVWALRRLALLRVQLVPQRGAEVLRTEEYRLSQDNVRVVYASALKAMPRMRNHRAIVVLSNGHVLVLHL